MKRAREIFLHARSGASLWLLLATVAVSLWVEESYPFSHFPMYSRFHRSTWYAYATDATGQPLPSLEVFRLSTPRIKKILNAELAAMAKDPASRPASEEAAGRKVLEMLAARAEPPQGSLGLWRVDIRRDPGGISRESHRIAILE